MSGGRQKSAHSVSSSSSRQSGPNVGASRPSTSFKSGGKQSSTSPSRQSCFQGGGRTFFNDLLAGGSSRMASSYEPVPQNRVCLDNIGSRMIFTGPDQTEKHRVRAEERGSYVGSVDMSRERTSDCGYLYRPSEGNQPRIRMRHERVGEIGWNTIHLKKVNPPR